MKNKAYPKGMLLNRAELSIFFGIARTTVDAWVHAERSKTAWFFQVQQFIKTEN
jgi:hypothetical protein